MSLMENVRCWIPFTLVWAEALTRCEWGWTRPLRGSLTHWSGGEGNTQPSSRGIFPPTFIREISYVFIQYYANTAFMHPCNPISGLCSPIETINTPSLQFGFNLQAMWVCVCVEHLCVFVWESRRECVCVYLMWVSDWARVCVCVCGGETAFGFGALLRREKKNIKTKKN